MKTEGCAPPLCGCAHAGVHRMGGHAPHARVWVRMLRSAAIHPRGEDMAPCTMCERGRCEGSEHSQPAAKVHKDSPLSVKPDAPSLVCDSPPCRMPLKPCDVASFRPHGNADLPKVWGRGHGRRQQGEKGKRTPPSDRNDAARGLAPCVRRRRWGVHVLQCVSHVRLPAGCLV